MDNTKKCKLELHNEIYNQEPVVFCKHCLSLKIRIVDETDYCDDCGSTDMSSANILEWEVLYKEKYNKEYITKKK